MDFAGIGEMAGWGLQILSVMGVFLLLWRISSNLGQLTEAVKSISSTQDDHESRLRVIEADNHHRAGRKAARKEYDERTT